MPDVPENPTIEPHADGFVYRHGQDDIDVQWVQVREIVGYRKHPAGEDVMCLGFRISAAEDVLEIPETAPGYADLLEAMYDALPKIDRTWWQTISASFGPNRMTIYGLAKERDEEPSPAERYLQQRGKRKRPRRSWRYYVPAVIALAMLAGLQVLLAWPLSLLSDLLALIVGPMLFVVVYCRFWPEPRPFFAALGSFLLLTWLWSVLTTGGTVPTLAGKLINGQLGYLLILGLEILVGLGVMLLPSRRATGKPLPRPKGF